MTTPPPKRRWWRWLLVSAILTGLATAGAVFRHPLLELLHRTGQRLARIGALEWQDPAGVWHPIAAADAGRLTWSPETAFLRPRWTPIAAGVEAADLKLARPPHPLTLTLALTRFDPAQWRLRVVGFPDWAERPVSDFADEFGLSFAVNASFFSSEGPIGLVVQDGVVRHRQASRKASHFLIDTPGGPVRIKNQKLAHIGSPYAGFQGFPAIMTGGKLYDYVRSGGRGFDVVTVDRRTAACVDQEGLLLVLVTDSITNGLSFAELGVVLGGLGCRDAMGFDGGSSTALELRIAGHERAIWGYKPVQVVLGAEPLDR
ncbi:MAG: phosphodiester glycosidase family protein [Myxococcales bacterium]|nr:phosphodiester glycosidase family protein [Myxococcales bacterium]